MTVFTTCLLLTLRCLSTSKKKNWCWIFQSFQSIKTVPISFMCIFSLYFTKFWASPWSRIVVYQQHYLWERRWRIDNFVAGKTFAKSPKCREQTWQQLFWRSCCTTYYIGAAWAGHHPKTWKNRVFGEECKIISLLQTVVWRECKAIHHHNCSSLLSLSAAFHFRWTY